MLKTRPDLSTEKRLLKFCAQVKISDNIGSRLEGLLANGLCWPYILEASKKEGISCLVYQNLARFKNRIPQDIWSRLERTYYTNACRNFRIYQETNFILSSFNQAGLAIIPLKSVFLAEQVYNNIALKTMADIDLLVRKNQLPRIEEILEGLGYNSPMYKGLRLSAAEKSYINSMDYFKTGEKSPNLHIHWHIVNVTLPAYMYTKNINMDRFFECARPTTLADAQTLEMAPHHLVIYLCEHALKHSFDRLILLSDLDAVIKKYKDELNWQELIAEARNLGMQRQLYYGLYFTKHFLGTDIAEQVLSGLKPARFGLFEGRFFNSILNNKRSSKLSYFVYLAMVKGVINKFRFVFRTLFPPPSVLALTFNLNKPRVSAKDYFSFLRRQFSHLKKLSN